MTADEPLVTVGLPTYNRAEYLDRSLSHLVGQSYENLEIIVSDNASTDDTPEICWAYEDKDHRVRYVRQETNRGPVKNYAEVLRRASGKYFMWHADDDYLEPAFISRAVAVLQEEPEAIACCCDYHQIDEEGNITGKWTLEHLYPDSPWKDGQLDFFRHPYTRSTMAFYALYRREALEAVGPPDPIRGGILGFEAPFLAEVAAQGRVIALPEVLFSYNNHQLEEEALAHTEARGLSAWDKFALHASTQSRILRSALTANASVSQRVRLVGACVGGAIRKVYEEITDVDADSG